MKKEYIAPVLEVVVIDTPKMLNGSPTQGSNPYKDGDPVLAPVITSFDDELDMD